MRMQVLKFTGKKYCKFYMKILAAILPTKPRTENTAFTGFHSNSLYILQVDVI